jgi:hypothetical protein
MRLSNLSAVFTALFLVATPLGCASTLTSQRRVEMVGGKQITYVVVKSGNSLLDHAMVCDRFGPDGTLLAHDTISNNGIVETLGGAALQTVVPAYNAFELVK